MKRLLAAIVGICVVGSVMAQSSFTIVRPADGSKVREKVRILIPKNSLESGSYVGVFLNGKFIEAVVPPTEGNYRVYTLDTKARGIADGEMKLELVKYGGGDAPKIVDRSSVTVTVGNQMNIPIPAGGVHLRYGFAKDQQLIYDINSVVTISTLSGQANEIGGRPAQFPTSEMSQRALYAVDNTYGNGDALLRVQNLPDKGKDYSILAITGEPEPRQVFDYQMLPTYMRVEKTGRPVFGSVPEYFGFSSGGAAEGGTFVYGSWPLPILPDKPVAPGSSWQTLYQLPVAIDRGKISDIGQVTDGFRARGEFVDAEWELGHPCAKIHNSIAAGTTSFQGKKLEQAGSAFADDKVALDETVYFALDIHKIVKIVRSITIDRKMTEQQQAGGGAGGGPAGVGGKGGPPGLKSGGIGGGFHNGGAPTPLNQGRPGLKGGGVGGGAGAGMPVGGGQGMGPGGRQGGGGGGAPRTVYVRTRFESIFLLEQ